jgi:hypothetical protein
MLEGSGVAEGTLKTLPHPVSVTDHGDYADVCVLTVATPFVQVTHMF